MYHCIALHCSSAAQVRIAQNKYVSECVDGGRSVLFLSLPTWSTTQAVRLMVSDYYIIRSNGTIDCGRAVTVVILKRFYLPMYPDVPAYSWTIRPLVNVNWRYGYSNPWTNKTSVGTVDVIF